MQLGISESPTTISIWLLSVCLVSGCVGDGPVATDIPPVGTEFDRDMAVVERDQTMSDIDQSPIGDIDAEIILDAVVPMDAEVDQMLVDVSVDMGPTSGAYSTAQVDEIFQRDCGSCHNSTASPPLNNGVRAWVNRSSGQSRLRLIQPGNHQQSYLYHKLADTHRDPPVNGSGTGMPPGRLLYSESRMERMALWIDSL